MDVLEDVSVVAMPTCLPVGGYYALDMKTGMNLGWTEDGLMPKRFAKESQAVTHGMRVNAKGWSQAQFRAAVGLVVVRRGGKLATAQDDCGAYEYAMETPAGRLLVNACEDWVGCRFVDVRAATAHVRTGSLNRQSGKWNWHGFSRAQTVQLFADAINVLMDANTG